MRYSVVGYDKDHDLYDNLWTTDSLENAIIQGSIFSDRQKMAELRSSVANEPFDWFEVVDSKGNLCWNSYSGKGRTSMSQKEIGVSCVVERLEQGYYRVICENGREDILRVGQDVHVGDVGHSVYFSDGASYGLTRFDRDPTVIFDFTAARTNYPYLWKENWPEQGSRLRFNISYEKNNVYCAIIVEAPTAEAAEQYFSSEEPTARICGLHKALIDDCKPGKPVLVVPDGWQTASLSPKNKPMDIDAKKQGCPELHARIGEAAERAAKSGGKRETVKKEHETQLY